MNQKPNVLIILADQLRACSLPNYGLEGISMPNFECMGRESITFTNAISTYPLCTPYRGMLLTGRHPQTNGLFLNYSSSRYDEIGLADAFKHAGYATGYVGKWHLNRGSFPSKNQCWIPEGRSRLGFDYWRAYNCHTEYFDGHVNTEDWHTEAWEGYETEGLLKYMKEFIEANQETPFLCVLSPHQPHHTGGKHAPDRYYEKLPEYLELPDNVDDPMKQKLQKDYHDYLAMILALDDMVGNVMSYLKEKGLLDNTIVLFTSDHGTQMGSHISGPTNGTPAWAKRRPYEESLKVPFFLHLPKQEGAGTVNDTLVAPVDIFPTLCSLAGVTIPRTVEGYDLSDAVLGKPGAFEQEALYLMNFLNYDYSPDWIPEPGNEWRGVRTKTHTYIKGSDGKAELYDLQNDPLELRNCIEEETEKERRECMERLLEKFMERHNDRIWPSSYYRAWMDQERRVVENAYGRLSFPETMPDWSQLRR